MSFLPACHGRPLAVVRRLLTPLAVCFALITTAMAPRCRAEVFVPGQTVPMLSDEVFTWSENQSNSTFAFWDSFADFPNQMGAIFPGTSPAPGASFADGGVGNSLTFNSFATLISGSGNAYGFNFAPGQPAFQPEFIIDAYATVRSGTSGGSHTRIVAQWQTQGSELDDGSILLSLNPASEGTVAPDLAMETGRTALGGFGGELVNYMAVWDLDSSQSEYRVDFNAQANHLSLDQFRVDSFTQSVPFVTPTAIPEPSSLAWLGMAAAGLSLRRRRRRPGGTAL